MGCMCFPQEHQTGDLQIGGQLQSSGFTGMLPAELQQRGFVLAPALGISEQIG